MSTSEDSEPKGGLIKEVEALRSSSRIGPYPIPNLTESASVVQPLEHYPPGDRQYRATTYQYDFPNWWRGKTVCRAEIWRRNGAMPCWNFLKWIGEIPKRPDGDETIYQTEFCHQQDLVASRESRRLNRIDVNNSPELKDSNSLFYSSVYNMDYRRYPTEDCFPSRPLEAPRQLHLTNRPQRSLPYPTPGIGAYKKHYETCMDRSKLSRDSKLPPLVSQAAL